MREQRFEQAPRRRERFGPARRKEPVALDIVLVGAELKQPLALGARMQARDLYYFLV
jgi:hypothetical protein